MSILIRVKRSDVSGIVPSILMHGELAINIPDGKLWIGGPNNLPVSIPITGPTGADSNVQGPIGNTGPTGPTGSTGATGTSIAGVTVSNYMLSVQYEYPDGTTAFAINDVYIRGPQGATGTTYGTTAGSFLSITDNTVKLDLQTGFTSDITPISKSDFMPFLKINNPTTWQSTGFNGTTKLVSAQDMLRGAITYMGVAQSTETPESVNVGLGNELSSALAFTTIGSTGGIKSNIFKISTVTGAEKVLINVETEIDSDTFLRVNTIKSHDGFAGITLNGDLYVTGRIVTSTGVFGATDNNIIEPVDNMNMDGGEF